MKNTFNYLIKNHLNNNQNLLLFFVLIIAFSLRFFIISHLDIKPTSDYYSYMTMAKSLLLTGNMTDPAGNVAFFSSGYPLFLVFFLAIFKLSPETVQVVNVFLGLTSVLLIYFCSKEFFSSWKWALVPTFCWAIYPPALLYTEYVAKENLMTPLMLCQLLILLKFKKSKHPILLSLILGTIFGLELLVGPAILLTILIIFIVILNFEKFPIHLMKLKWSQFSVFIISCLLTLSPWLTYTKIQLGKAIITTNGGYNLYIGNNPNSGVFFQSITDTPIGNKWHKLKKEKGEIEAFSILKRKALKYIIENPKKTFIHSLEKFFYFWTPPIHAGENNKPTKSEILVRCGWLVMYSLILTASFIPLFFINKLKRSHFILLATVFFYCAIHMATYVIFRYRLPIMPMMCILATCGIKFISRKA